MSQFNHNPRCDTVPVVTGTYRYGICNSVGTSTMTDINSKEIDELLQSDSEDDLPEEPLGNEDDLSRYKFLMDLFEITMDDSGDNDEIEEKKTREKNREQFHEYKSLHDNLQKKLEIIKQKKLAFANRRKESRKKSQTPSQ